MNCAKYVIYLRAVRCISDRTKLYTQDHYITVHTRASRWAVGDPIRICWQAPNVDFSAVGRSCFSTQTSVFFPRSHFPWPQIPLSNSRAAYFEVCAKKDIGPRVRDARSSLFSRSQVLSPSRSEWNPGATNRLTRRHPVPTQTHKRRLIFRTER